MNDVGVEKLKNNIQERWVSISKAWVLYKQQPDQPDSLVHFLIMLDSFITYADQLALEEVVTNA